MAFTQSQGYPGGYDTAWSPAGVPYVPVQSTSKAHDANRLDVRHETASTGVDAAFGMSMSQANPNTLQYGGLGDSFFASGNLSSPWNVQPQWQHVGDPCLVADTAGTPLLDDRARQGDFEYSHNQTAGPASQSPQDGIGAVPGSLGQAARQRPRSNEEPAGETPRLPGVVPNKRREQENSQSNAKFICPWCNIEYKRSAYCKKHIREKHMGTN